MLLVLHLLLVLALQATVCVLHLLTQSYSNGWVWNQDLYIHILTLIIAKSSK